jgi:hypothetical protein
MTKGRMVYITKYALSSGVITGTVDTESKDYYWVVMPSGRKDLFYRKEAFLSLEDAIAPGTVDDAIAKLVCSYK